MANYVQEGRKMNEHATESNKWKKEGTQTATILIGKDKLLSSEEIRILKEALDQKKDLAISILCEDNGTGFDLAITTLDLKGKGLEACPIWCHPNKHEICRAPSEVPNV